MNKTIITAATTGSSLTPSMSPHLPANASQIVEQSLGAVDAGAAIVHLHARNPDGSATRDVGVWREIVDGIRDKSDVIINMSASMGLTAEERLEASLALRPDIATVIVGSMNYGLFRKAQNQGISEFELDWEKKMFGPSSYEIVTDNTFAKIDQMIRILLAEDIGMEFECYDVGHLYILEHHLKKHDVKKPIILQFLTGILGGIPSDIEHLVHLKTTALSLFGADTQLFIHGTGMANIRTATAGALLGTHVRVGQEDNLFDRPGVPFASNAAQVERVCTILGHMNLETANVAEARQELGMVK